ncbi:MAG: S1 RNA-binding domain-containing protein [Myxococcales bacterium]|nr:S1 RNA-binding domain-containing protein [Myxococcales bacterium]
MTDAPGSTQSFKVGQVVHGQVSAKMPFGVFVALPGGEFGLVLVTQAHEQPSTPLPEVGTFLRCVIVGITVTEHGTRHALSCLPADFAEAEKRA